MPVLDVLDSTISYTDRGTGTPIVLLHGNPGSSHVWRKVLDHLPDDLPARVLAPDLIGMGRSGKPDSEYRFGDHARYLDAWFDALGLDRVVLVGHDWGGSLALDRAARLPERVLGVAFFETVLRPMSWTDLPEGGRTRFQALRAPGTGERMVLEDNDFITVALPRTMITELSAAESAVYAEPYPTPRSRRPLLAWARSMPVDGDPPDVHARVEAYDEWLAASQDVPKLLITFSGHPTLMVDPGAVEWCRANIAGLEVVDGGVAGHVAPEDRPVEIAAAISAWVTEHGLLRPAGALAGEPSTPRGEVHRIDRFVVPDAAVEEFMAGVHRTHHVLRGLPGFRGDLLLEGERTAGTTRILTLVAWADEDALAAARRVVHEHQQREGTDPQQTFTRLGITPDLGLYRPTGS